MSKDFAKSHEQRAWEYACKSHARACEQLDYLENISKRSDVILQAVDFWRRRKEDAEREFPCLSRGISGAAHAA